MNRFTSIVGIATLIFFGLGGIWMIKYYQEKDFLEILVEHGLNIPMQLLIGLGAGGVSAAIGLFIITRPFFQEEKRHYYELICTRLKPSIAGIIFISLSAGIGEEIFFRAGLQPLIGLWPTSIIFVFIHGYFNIRNCRIAVYGIFMLLIIAGFGYLFRYTGLISVMMAHAVYDFILLLHVYITRKGRY